MLYANVDAGWLRLCTADTSAFHKGANVRCVTEWTQSDKPGSDFTHVRRNGVRV